MTTPHSPLQIMPAELAAAVDPLPYWFVIGGQAVRCFAPYRPSRDVDFGIDAARNLDDFLRQLTGTGGVEVLERADDTVHVLWNGLKVSVFVLPHLTAFVENRHLDVTGILATKLHAILDRGLRRDFFDLYVMLQQHRLGVAALLGAIRAVHAGHIDEGILLRSLTFFDDADREAQLPGEGPRDWKVVKDYFLKQVGSLITPPLKRLTIQDRTVDVDGG